MRPKLPKGPHPIAGFRYAHIAVARAIRDGLLVIPLTCEACGIVGTRGTRRTTRRTILAHHHSYAPEHWLDVIPLCVQCHQWVHHGRVPEPRTGRVYPSPLKNRRARSPESFRHGMTPQRGRRRADLTADEVAAIWRMRADTRLGTYEVGQLFGVGASIVQAIWREHVAMRAA